MRKLHSSPVVLLAFLLLAVIVPAFAARARFATARFIPPAEPGQIFTVINYDRAGGRTQVTGINVDWGRASRRITVAPPYRAVRRRRRPPGSSSRCGIRGRTRSR